MARRNHITERDLGYRRIMRDLRRSRNSTVEIGIHEGSTTPEGLTIAEYAMYNEYGTDEIPERSFMRSTFDENLGGFKTLIARQWGRFIRGESTIFRALSRIGMEHETQVKQKIRDLKTPPNAPYTIAKKRSDNPLIDTSAMVNSVRYVVKANR